MKEPLIYQKQLIWLGLNHAAHLTLAPSTWQTVVFDAPEMTVDASLATIADRSILATQTNSIVDRPTCQVFHQFQSSHISYTVVGRTFDTNVRVSVAIVNARHTFAIIPRIADIQWHALFALCAHRVVVTLQTCVQLIGSLAIGVAIALALNAAVGSYIAEITSTHVRLDAIATHTTFGNKEAN